MNTPGTPSDLASGAVTRTRRRRGLAVAFGLGLLAIGFLSGWIVSRHIVLAPLATEPRAQAARGDAPDSVREGVLRSLREFQEGYTRRNPEAIGPFMERLFLPGKSALLLGTDSGEWMNGTEQITNFIRNDWQSWGDVSLDPDAATISAAGDVAWLVDPGSVRFAKVTRTIRFTATLVRTDGRWHFRQVQFQWDDNSGLGLSDLLRPSTYSRLRWR